MSEPRLKLLIQLPSKMPLSPIDLILPSKLENIVLVLKTLTLRINVWILNWITPSTTYCIQTHCEFFSLLCSSIPFSCGLQAFSMPIQIRSGQHILNVFVPEVLKTELLLCIFFNHSSF